MNRLFLWFELGWFIERNPSRHEFFVLQIVFTEFLFQSRFFGINQIHVIQNRENNAPAKNVERTKNHRFAPKCSNDSDGNWVSDVLIWADGYELFWLVENRHRAFCVGDKQQIAPSDKHNTCDDEQRPDNARKDVLKCHCAQ